MPLTTTAMACLTHASCVLSIVTGPKAEVERPLPIPPWLQEFMSGRGEVLQELRHNGSEAGAERILTGDFVMVPRTLEDEVTVAHDRLDENALYLKAESARIDLLTMKMDELNDRTAKLNYLVLGMRGDLNKLKETIADDEDFVGEFIVKMTKWTERMELFATRRKRWAKEWAAGDDSE